MTEPLLVQMSARRLHVSDRSAAWDEARERFRRDHHLCLPGFLAPGLTARLQKMIATATFTERIATKVQPPAVDFKLRDDMIHGVLHFLMNQPELFGRIRLLSGCGPIGAFVGAVYRLRFGAGHRDSWHNDMDGNRLVALTLNLSRELFRGGELQIRDRASGDVLAKVGNTGSGDAVLFELSNALQHRVGTIEEGPDKDAFAGWFCRTPHYDAAARGRPQKTVDHHE